MDNNSIWPGFIDILSGFLLVLVMLIVPYIFILQKQIQELVEQRQYTEIPLVEKLQAVKELYPNTSFTVTDNETFYIRMCNLMKEFTTDEIVQVLLGVDVLTYGRDGFELVIDHSVSKGLDNNIYKIVAVKVLEIRRFISEMTPRQRVKFSKSSEDSQCLRVYFGAHQRGEDEKS